MTTRDVSLPPALFPLDEPVRPWEDDRGRHTLIPSQRAHKGYCWAARWAWHPNPETGWYGAHVCTLRPDHDSPHRCDPVRTRMEHHMTADLSGRRQQARVGGAAVEREIDNALERLAAEREEQRAAARARWEADRALEGCYTRDDLLGARAVRDATGWHRVVRINPVSITIPDAWGASTRRIGFAKVREFRA